MEMCGDGHVEQLCSEGLVMNASKQSRRMLQLVVSLGACLVLAGCGAEKDAEMARPHQDQAQQDHSVPLSEDAGEGGADERPAGVDEPPVARLDAPTAVPVEVDPVEPVPAVRPDRDARLNAIRRPTRSTLPSDLVRSSAPPTSGAVAPIEAGPPAMPMAAPMADTMMNEEAESVPALRRLPEDSAGSAAEDPDLAPLASAAQETHEPAFSESKPGGEPATSLGSESSLPYRELTVFYATDRQAREASPESGVRWGIGPLTLAAGFTLLTMLLGSVVRRRLIVGLAVGGGIVTVALGGYWVWENRDQLQQVADPGIRYGNERGEMQYGTCRVTIPLAHETGEVERPSILRLEVREDVARHVVLQSTLPASEAKFFEQLRQRVAASDAREVFVFVHGYNVTFDGAARRTAQIAHDVEFAGAPIFFSWPSQGGLLKYTIDENNVEWAIPHLRQFLLDVTQHSGAKSVNLIAHSMGSRALTAALRELQTQLSQEAMFNQIILAAPDIDADIFRRDLAPALVRSARRVTLYASSNDQALLASKQVHGYARAGDSGAGLVVLPGIETIDVSSLDTSLLGHSYYGSSDPILLDIRQMIQLALPAAQRPFLLPHSYGELTYWVFDKVRTATRREPGTTAQ